MDVGIKHSTVLESRVVPKETVFHFDYALIDKEHAGVVDSMVVLEGAVDDIDGGISDTSHTPSGDNSGCRVTRKDAVCKVDAKVVKLIDIQHATVRRRVVSKR